MNMIYIRQQGQWFCWLLASSAAGGGLTFSGCGRSSVYINLSGHPDAAGTFAGHNHRSGRKVLGCCNLGVKNYSENASLDTELEGKILGL